MNLLKKQCARTGGSNIKYNYEILTLKTKFLMSWRRKRRIYEFSADLMSEYGGIFSLWFSSVRNVPIRFGYDVKSVYAVSEPTNTIVTVRYTDKLVTLNFNGKTSKYFMTVHGAKTA